VPDVKVTEGIVVLEKLVEVSDCVDVEEESIILVEFVGIMKSDDVLVGPKVEDVENDVVVRSSVVVVVEVVVGMSDVNVVETVSVVVVDEVESVVLVNVWEILEVGSVLDNVEVGTLDVDLVVVEFKSTSFPKNWDPDGA
jgi:hypothetical protein